jgi:hypothetical protein
LRRAEVTIWIGIVARGTLLGWRLDFENARRENRTTIKIDPPADEEDTHHHHSQGPLSPRRSSHHVLNNNPSIMEPRTLRWTGWTMMMVCAVMAILPAAVKGFATPTPTMMLSATIGQSNGGFFYFSLHATTSETDGSSSSSPSSSNKPELPAVPGDFDWDAKYGADPDWLMGANVPGRGKLSDIELARQATALGGLEDKWRRERDIQEYENSAKTGFVPKAELLNGRAAMFFLVTGLLTEYWTGISIPGQVEEMLRIAGVIGFD